MQIPLLDLRAQYASLQKQIQEALARICASQRFILGPEGEALERALAATCGVAHAIGCASGSDALLLSLVALGIEPGDEVATTPFGFFSTAGSIARLGARAAFVDIEPRTFNLDPRKLEAHLLTLSSERRRRTSAMLVVHLFGQPCDMDPIQELAARYQMLVIEDAAQAMGAEYRGRRVGGMGHTGCFSFYPTKNLGGYGDGGLVTTNDDTLAETVRALRHHGSTGEKYRHELLGWNSRLDELQAAVLRVKLAYLEAWTAARQHRAAEYDRLFLDTGLTVRDQIYPDAQKPVVIPHRSADVRHVYHQYVIRARDRDRLRAYLAEAGIGTEVYYPLPLHLQPCFQSWGAKTGDFPEAERAAREVLALPLYPELSAEAQSYVVSKVADFYCQPTAV
jgi:dTDP-4-amino-4,6-dideoxygalactose transaminase